MTTDSFSPFDDVLADSPSTQPWAHGRGEPADHRSDYEMLRRILAVREARERRSLPLPVENDDG